MKAGKPLKVHQPWSPLDFQVTPNPAGYGKAQNGTEQDLAQLGKEVEPRARAT